MSKEFSKAFYKSKEWQSVRNYCLLRDKYLCVMCGEPAEEVHHIIHLTPLNINDISITLNPNNLKCLCKDCHFKEHSQDRKDGRSKINYEYVFDESGQLVPASPPV